MSERWLLCFVLLVALIPGAVAGPEQPADDAQCIPSKACESATVQQVFRAESDGFKFVSYRVVWRGQEIIVEDPVSWTNLAVGDTLRFLVSKSDLSSKPGGGKYLSFIARKQQ